MAFTLFPQRWRSTITGAFLAGVFGFWLGARPDGRGILPLRNGP